MVAGAAKLRVAGGDCCGDLFTPMSIFRFGLYQRAEDRSNRLLEIASIITKNRDKLAALLRFNRPLHNQ